MNALMTIWAETVVLAVVVIVGVSIVMVLGKNQLSYDDDKITYYVTMGVIFVFIPLAVTLVFFLDLNFWF